MNTCTHCAKEQYISFMWGSTVNKGEALLRLRLNHRSYMWKGAISDMVFVPAQEVPGIVWNASVSRKYVYPFILQNPPKMWRKWKNIQNSHQRSLIWMVTKCRTQSQT